MIDWLKKKFGYHVCDFTQWEIKHEDFMSLPNAKHWQERKCKTCGYIQTEIIYY